MEKIKLLGGTEFPAYEFEEYEDKLGFTVSGISNYAEFRNTLNSNNLSTIEVYSEGGALSTVFEGYTDLTGKFGIIENEDGTMDVTVYLEKPDPVLAKLAALEIKIAELEAEKTK
ncbi:MAG: hypothetical protein E7255_00165 [Lachnospiraceae bacterium]|nr:hypothetical protein [Lachnospiraceae bacterium]